METNTVLLEKGSFKDLLFKLCLPTVIIMVVMIVYNMADTYFIGQTGDPDMVAAVSICAPVFTLVSGLGTLFGSGGCTVISLALGKGDDRRVRTVSSICCWGSIALGLVFSVGSLLFTTPISVALGSNADTLSYTDAYLRIIALGGPFILFAHVFANLVRADGAAVQSMIGNAAGTILNIILDAIFILGLGWGVAGAALATLIGNLASALYFFWYVGFKDRVFSMSPKDFRLDLRLIGRILALGLPMAASTLLISLSSMITNSLLMGYGAVPTAAYNITSKFTMLISMLAMGLTMGMQPAISYSFAEGNFKRLKKIVKNTGIFSVIAGIVLCLICWVFREPLFRTFLDNEETIGYCRWFVWAALLPGPFIGLYSLCQTFLQSIGQAGKATFAAILDKGLFLIPLLFILRSALGLAGVVYAQVVSILLSLITAGWLSLDTGRKLKASEKTSEKSTKKLSGKPKVPKGKQESL